MTKNIIVSGVLFGSVGLTLLFNTFLIINVCLRKRLRARATIATSMLYVHLGIVDILGSLLWSATSAYSALVGEWPLWDVACTIQVYIRLFCYMANSLTLVCLMTERALRMFKPAKRQTIHNRNNFVLLIYGTYVACACLSAFPALPRSPVTEQYAPTEFQCVLNTEDSTTYFPFIMAVTVGLPYGIILIWYIAVLVKLSSLKRWRVPRKYIALHHDAHESDDAYFKRIQTEILKTFGKKDPDNERKLEKLSAEGYFIDTIDDSSDEEFEENDTTHPHGWTFLSRSDIQLTHAYAITSAIYLAIWIPYFIHFYKYTYDGEDDYGQIFVLVAVCLSHFGGVCKVPFYLISDNVRGAVGKSLCCKPTVSKGHKADQQREQLHNGTTHANNFQG